MQESYAIENDDNLSLAYLVIALLRRRRSLLKPIILAGIFGLVVAILLPRNFLARAIFIRETTSESSGIISGGLAALSGLGLNIASGESGLTVETYPDIIGSREVQMAVLRRPIYFTELDTTMAMVDYFGRDSNHLFSTLVGYALWLPRKLAGDYPSVKGNVREGLLQPMSKTEVQARRWLQSHTSVTVDRSTGIMNVSVTSKNPYISYQLVDNYLYFMTKRIQDLHTQMLRGDLVFIEARFQDAKSELLSAEEALVRFMDQNRFPETAKLKAERASYQRKVDFKSQLYSDFQAQLTQAEVEFQRSQPILTILEEPHPPLKASGIGRKMIVLMILFFGFVIGSTGIILEEYYYSAIKRNDANSAIVELFNFLRKPSDITIVNDKENA